MMAGTVRLSTKLEDYGDFLTVAEAAAVLRIGRATAYDYIRDGVIPSVQMGRRLVIAKAAIVRMTSCPGVDE